MNYKWQALFQFYYITSSMYYVVLIVSMLKYRQKRVLICPNEKKNENKIVVYECLITIWTLCQIF